MFSLREIYYVAWADLKFMRHNIVSIVIAITVGPLLYLLAFGFGLGQGLESRGVPYIAFIIPGIVALTSLSSSFSSVSSRIHVQRLVFRSLDELIMCPISASSIVLGKSIHGAVRGLLGSSVILVLGLLLEPGYLRLTLPCAVCIVISCFTFSFLGMSAGLIARSHQGLANFSNLVILPMTFLCGTFFPVDALPTVFRAALYTLPLTHSAEVIRASALGWGFPYASFIVLLCFCSALFILNVYLIKKKKV